MSGYLPDIMGTVESTFTIGDPTPASPFYNPNTITLSNESNVLAIRDINNANLVGFRANYIGGNIDGVDIGDTTPAAGTFSSLAVKIGGFTGSFSHANTANRVYTFPDATDTVVLLTLAQTLTNKTLTTPTIGDFTNANHNHQNAAGGGSLDAAAIGSGTFNNARVNWAAPSAIGGTTPASGAFTTLTNTGLAILGQINSFTIPASYATGALGVSWNLSNGGAEMNLYNLYSNGGGFIFSQKTGASTKLDVLKVDGSGNATIVANLAHTGSNAGFFNHAVHAQPTAAGLTTGFVPHTGNGMFDQSTATGNIGSSAYTFSDIVAALKNVGLIAA